jgi:hypothetical protein
VVAAAPAVAAAVVAVGDADRHIVQRTITGVRMKVTSANRSLARVLWLSSALATACLFFSALTIAQQSAMKKSSASVSGPGAGVMRFDTPQQGASALVDAAEKFDVGALEKIFGPAYDDIVLLGEYSQDRKLAADFAAEAREKTSISVDPKIGNRAFLLVGKEDWPFPVPLVKQGGQWLFDTKAGQQELLYRRIGANELDAIQVCRGYVDAQYDYAFQKRDGYDVNQYAQRIISSPGKQDGLAWQTADGTWEGPIGEKIALAIQQGLDSGEPYHGYFFKILKGQGPAAPLGAMNFVVKGVMIGGFALAAAPAEYGVTGMKTFIVSDDGVVYEKDFGPNTLDTFKAMELFNPDKSWIPVSDDDES